jgi:hypothetical protein
MVWHSGTGGNFTFTLYGLHYAAGGFRTSLGHSFHTDLHESHIPNLSKYNFQLQMNFISFSLGEGGGGGE